MATKKAKDKAVKKVGRAVRNAVNKGVTRKGGGTGRRGRYREERWAEAWEIQGGLTTEEGIEGRQAGRGFP
jgi:hypothetical protein